MVKHSKFNDRKWYTTHNGFKLFKQNLPVKSKRCWRQIRSAGSVQRVFLLIKMIGLNIIVCVLNTAIINHHSILNIDLNFSGFSLTILCGKLVSYDAPFVHLMIPINFLTCNPNKMYKMFLEHFIIWDPWDQIN